VPVAQLKTMRDEEIICKPCQKIEETAKKKIEIIFKRAEGEIKKMKDDFRELVNTAVQESLSDD
jgi:hypothetical protein